jgi:hypothetical protein
MKERDILLARHVPGTVPGCRLSPWCCANSESRVAHVSSMCSDLRVLSKTNWAVCEGTTLDNDSFLMVPVSCSWTTNFPCWVIWQTVPESRKTTALSYERKENNLHCFLYFCFRNLISHSVIDAHQLNYFIALYSITRRYLPHCWKLDW